MSDYAELKVSRSVAIWWKSSTQVGLYYLIVTMMLLLIPRPLFERISRLINPCFPDKLYGLWVSTKFDTKSALQVRQ